MAELVSIDTNVIVRFLTKDDPQQFETATSIIRDNQVFVPDTVMLETEWVLRFAYEFEPQSIIDAFRRFLGLGNVIVENMARLEQAVEWHENGLDFADALHLASCQHTSTFATFDKALCKKSPNTSSCRLQQLDA